MSSRYQVVIPKMVREALGLGPQTTLLFLVDDDSVMIRPCPESFSAALEGLHSELWVDSDTWIEGERSSWE